MSTYRKKEKQRSVLIISAFIMLILDIHRGVNEIAKASNEERYIDIQLKLISLLHKCDAIKAIILFTKYVTTQAPAHPIKPYLGISSRFKPILIATVNIVIIKTYFVSFMNNTLTKK